MAAEPRMTSDEHALDDSALEALAEAYAEPAPPALRVRLMATVTLDRERRRASTRLLRMRAVGALAAALAVVFAGLFARQSQRGSHRTEELATLARQNEQLEARLDEQGRTLVGLRAALDAQGQILRLVGGPRILTATLAPQKGVVGAGRVLVDAGSGDAAIVVSGLAAPGEGKTYELWAIRGKKAPEPAGLIAFADAEGGAIRIPNVPRPAEVTAFAISIEPSGGSDTPTGPIVFTGAIAG